MTRLRIAALCSAILGMGQSVSHPVAAQAAEKASQDSATQQDWPSIIARLQQDVYQRPGLATTRQQLAIAYNNYGVVLSERGEFDQAAQQLQEALRIDASNAQYRTNLSHLYLRKAYDAFQRQQAEAAAQLVDQAIMMTPDLAHAYALRGEIEYGRQRLKEAKAAWERAVKLDPTLPDVARRLAQVTQELPVESKFERLSQVSFDLRYEEQIEQPSGFDIRDALLDARRAVGGHFAYWPKHKFVVLIYSAASFRSLRQEMPDWVAGQFDGKIRIPVPGAQLDPTTVRQILFHEYTHALIYDLTEGKCPIWLNEGLAEYEGATQKPLVVMHLARAVQEQRIIPWAELNEQFSTALSVDDVALAYQEARSIVHYLVERYGFWRIRRILTSVKAGKTLEETLASEFRMKPATLEKAWLQWLPRYLSSAS